MTATSGLDFELGLSGTFDDGADFLWRLRVGYCIWSDVVVKIVWPDVQKVEQKLVREGHPA
jgi:hypothetical protein